MGSRSPRILSSNLRGVCMHLFIVKNHSAPLSFSSLLTPPPFFSRAFSANLNEIPLVAPVVRDVGDPNPESEEMLPSASGPPGGRILAEVRAARASGGLGSRGGASWVLWAGGRWRVGLRTRALHLCVLPAATAPPAARAWPGRTQLEPSLGSWSGRRARLGPRAGNSGPSRPASRSFRPMDLSIACLPPCLTS